MKLSSFRTAQRGVLNRVPGIAKRCGVTAVILGIAVSLSATGASTQPSAVAGKLLGTKAKAKHHWYQVGIASWYGHEFQGRRTATGERFDMNGMTCAHPTLPMGTWLKVTNLKNRQTTFVRVNDRGPVIEGRIIDLSFAAAHALGLRGLGEVKLETLPAGDPDLVKGLMAQVRMPVLFDGSGRERTRAVLN